MEEFSGITILSAIISCYSFLLKFFNLVKVYENKSLILPHKFVLCTWHITKESAEKEKKKRKKEEKERKKKRGEDRYRIAFYGM